jgi:hypothetical protein
MQQAALHGAGDMYPYRQVFGELPWAHPHRVRNGWRHHRRGPQASGNHLADAEKTTGCSRIFPISSCGKL